MALGKVNQDWPAQHGHALHPVRQEHVLPVAVVFQLVQVAGLYRRYLNILRRKLCRRLYSLLARSVAFDWIQVWRFKRPTDLFRWRESRKSLPSGRYRPRGKRSVDICRVLWVVARIGPAAGGKPCDGPGAEANSPISRGNCRWRSRKSL